MIVEQRTYTFAPGLLGPFLELYENEGLALQRSYLGPLVGYYVTEIGQLNRTVSMWAYEDLADRTTRRDKLFSDPNWTAYLARVRPLMTSQETSILKPAVFFAPLLSQIMQLGRNQK